MSDAHERFLRERLNRRIAELKAMTPEERAADFVSRYETEVFTVGARKTIRWWDGERTVEEPCAPVVEVYPDDNHYTATFKDRAELEAFIAELRAAADEAWPEVKP